MDGDGTSDYFWIDQDGRGWGYLNIGKGKDVWQNLGQIADPKTPHKRELIRTAVLSRSGRADYVVVEEATGKAFWWQNLGKDSGWSWADRGEFAAGVTRTIEGVYGWKFHGKNVRFAEYVVPPRFLDQLTKVIAWTAMDSMTTFP